MSTERINEARELLQRWNAAAGEDGSNDAEHDTGTDMAEFIAGLFGWDDIEGTAEEREAHSPDVADDGTVGESAFDVEITGVIRVKGMTRSAARERVQEIDCYSIDTYLGPDLKVMITEISVDRDKIEMFEFEQDKG
jgi:hypothetical protein